MRKDGRLPFRHLGAILNLARHIPLTIRMCTGRPSFYRAGYQPFFSSICPRDVEVIVAFLPDLEMANYVQRERAIAASKDTLSPRTCPPICANRRVFQMIPTAGRSGRDGYVIPRCQRSLIPQELPIQAFALYHLRFVLCGFMSRLVKLWMDRPARSRISRLFYTSRLPNRSGLLFLSPDGECQAEGKGS